jgi:hypothetical protein
MKQLIGIVIVVLLFFGIWAVFTSLTQQENDEDYRNVAEAWVVEESLTYPYDGSNLEYTNTTESEEGVYEHTFSFESSQAGYGDRTGDILAQVITPHEIVVTIRDGQVVSAVTDGVYNEMTGTMISENGSDDKQVLLYFYREEDDLDNAGNVLCSAEAVVGTERIIEDYSIEKHIETLLLGPTAGEEANGFSSEFPLEGLSVSAVSGPDSDGVLTVTLEDTTNATTGGSCRVGILSAQVEKTALSIEGVESVVLLPEELFQP